MSYINSNDIFVYPCANRGEGFWESKLATEYSLRTLIPWKITKRSFVISDNPQDTNLEFVVNGYYFKVSDWRTKVPATSNLWAHIKINTKPLVSGSENTESTEILIPYDNVSTLDYDNSGTYEFHGILFDTNSADNDQTNTYPYIFHLQITNSNGDFMHRDSIEIACEEPIEQDSNTGELLLKIGNGLKIGSTNPDGSANNNKLIARLGTGLAFEGSTDGIKAIKVTNAITEVSPASTGNLESLKIGGVKYDIPQGQTYMAGRGITINNNVISAESDWLQGLWVEPTSKKQYLALANSYMHQGTGYTVYPGLQFVVSNSDGISKGLQVKLASNGGLSLDSNGIKVTQPIPTFSQDNIGQVLKIATSSGTPILAWVAPDMATTIRDATTSYPTLTIGSGLSIANNTLSVTGGGSGSYTKGDGIDITNNTISVKLYTTNTGGVNYYSGLAFTDGMLKVNPGNGLTIDGQVLKIKTGSGLSFDGNGALYATGGGGTTYSEGNGITINSSNNISVDLATNSGLTFDTNTKLKIALKNKGGLVSNSNNNGLSIGSGTGETTTLRNITTAAEANIYITGYTYGDMMCLHIDDVSVTASNGAISAVKCITQNKLLSNANITQRFGAQNGGSIDVYTSDNYLMFTFTPAISPNNQTDYKYLTMWVRK